MYLVVHLKFSFQEHVQNSVKNLRWSFMQKLREIFSKMKIISCNIYIRQFFETANLAIASKSLKSFSFIILQKKLLQSIFSILQIL